MKPSVLILSCEHAGNRVPESYQHLFAAAHQDLMAHTGWDPGALELMTFLSVHLQAPSFSYPYTRLLIEANRSEDNEQLFSNYTSGLPNADKKHLVEHYYRPYRQEVTQTISELISQNQQVVHLSVHSFTPIWQGKERKVEIGLLYDDARPGEKVFCQLWHKNLAQKAPHMVVRANEPYQGTDDGFTTHLRKQFSDTEYLGIELEVNQKFVNSRFEAIQHLILASLAKTFENYADSRNQHLRRGDQKD